MARRLGGGRRRSRAEDPGRPKYYVLEMFPYPSGRLHVGHARNYAMGDVVARFKRARGYNVLHPMGWDAFGLPAENAAAERGVDPRAWTLGNIDVMREELQRLGLSIDWSREFATCDPDYYGTQQAWFLRLWARGLVYRKEGLVNWDPVDMTVLANEQVIDGRGWRSDALVERRKLTQWFLRITDYADELLEGLKTLDRWPDKVRLMQENWIGRSKGLRIAVRFRGDRRGGPGRRSTRPGRTPCSAPASSPWRPTIRWPSGWRRAIPRGRLRRGMPPRRHLRGRDRNGREAGLRHRPACASIRSIRTGAAGLDRQLRPDGLRHRRDLRLPGARSARPRLRPQVRPAGDAGGAAAGRGSGDLRGAGRGLDGSGRIFNSGFMDGLDVEAAKAAAIARAEGAGQGKGAMVYRLRDWGVSRQRGWGCPIPVIHCPAAASSRCRRATCPSACRRSWTSADRATRWRAIPTWKHITCPNCGGPAERETDTLDTFVDFVLVLRPLRRSARSGADRAGRRLLAAGRPVHRRHRARGAAPALRPLRHPGAARRRHARRSTSRSPACSRRAWSLTRPTGVRTASGSNPRRSRSSTKARRDAPSTRRPASR